MSQVLKLTAAEIEAAKTEKGGWTKATLAGWGVSWPAAEGLAPGVDRGG